MRESRATPADMARWRATERGELPAVAAGAPRMAFVYPNTYAVGMSSLGFQTTLATFRREGVDAERFFAYAPQRSIETDAPVHRFGIIAFSIAFEMDWLNILRFLQEAGIPLRANERGPEHPLILVGGICVTVNRQPIWPFADVILHGDSESLAPEIARLLREPGLERRELLRALGRLQGAEITYGCAQAHGIDECAGAGAEAAPKPPERAVLTELDGEPCVTRIFSPEAEFADMGLIDLGRGCPHHCTFCWIGHNAPDYRARSIESIMGLADYAMRYTDRLGLVSSAVGAHPLIDEIVSALLDRKARLSYSSLRVEEVTPIMLQALAAGGQKSITVAPEAGSMRVRRLLGKRLPDDRIFEVIDWALEQGMLSIKLYFMTGIPSETEDEADEIVRFVEQVRGRMLLAGKKSGQMGNVVVNLGLFVPKPNLPLMRMPVIPDLDTVSRRLKRIVRLLNRVPNTRVMASSPELNAAQGVLSVGGPESVDFLLDALAENGDWRRAFQRWRKSEKYREPAAVA